MSELKGSCHCGAVKFTVTSGKPEWLTSCNCSSCNRHGALWLHEALTAIKLTAAPDATLSYLWGDKSLTTYFCRTCGCTTHWLPVDPVANPQMAVNARMMAKEDIVDIRIRRFDGADTWSFLD